MLDKGVVNNPPPLPVKVVSSPKATQDVPIFCSRLTVAPSNVPATKNPLGVPVPAVTAGVVAESKAPAPVVSCALVIVMSVDTLGMVMFSS